MAFRSTYQKVLKKIVLHLSKRTLSFRTVNTNAKYLRTQKLTLPNKTVVSYRYFSTGNDGSNVEDDIEIDYHYEHDMEIVSIRNILYPNSDDPLITRLNDCSSVQDVFNIVNASETQMDVTHVSQAVLVLWDLQKIFYRYNMFYDQSEEEQDANAVLRNYQNQVNSHEDFEKLMNLIENKYQDFTLDALTCTLLYLHRMGVKLDNHVIQLIIRRCEAEMLKNQSEFPLTALSRFLVTVYDEEGYWPISVSQNAIPIVLNRLELCESIDDFKLITICLNKLHVLLTTETLNSYKAIGSGLIRNNKINYENHRAIIKAVRFLSYPQWFEQNLATIKEFMYLLKNHVDILTTRELILLFKVFQAQKEPADMLQEIQETISKRLSNLRDDSNNSVDEILELLSCIVPFSSPLQRLEFEKIIQVYINKNLMLHSLNSVHQILYHIKSSDSNLCNKLWDKYIELILNLDAENRLPRLINICHKYMHFNNDNQYRYFDFEKRIEKLLLHELKHSIASIIPSKYAKIASFLIAYSNNGSHLEAIAAKLKDIQNQLNVFDCLIISKGIQNASQGNKNRYSQHLNIMRNITNTINDRCDLELSKSNLNVQSLNIVLRSYMMRKSAIDNRLYGALINQHFSNAELLTSNVLKDLTFSLHVNDSLIPNVMEEIVDSVIGRQQSILGNTINKVLYLCYCFGYTSKRQDELLDLSVDLINRDKDRFSGLTYLQAALALCFYQRLPENLVTHIFSVSFLEKLDEELSYCYAKATYPLRVRDNLMQLNRAVCIDYPGSSVPWFHEKYTEELKKKEMKISKFHQTVSKTMMDIFDDYTTVSENVISPYGYNIDFEICFDKEKDNSSYTKYALLLLTTKAFSSFHVNLKGFYQLQQRHLEILGYNVVSINQSEWNSLYTQEGCAAYIKSKLWPNSNRLESASC